MIKILKFFVIMFTALVLGIMILTYYKNYRRDYKHEMTSTEMKAGEDVTVTIPKDASAEKIASILHKAGLIKYERAFLERLQDSEYRGRLSSGTFTLNTGWNTLRMMEEMSVSISSEENSKKLVIPEGFSVDMIAERCEELDICSKTDFINAVKSVTTSDFPFLSEVPSGANVRYKMEGFLFPATYTVPEGTTAEQLVNMMMDAFENYYTQSLRDRAAELEMSTFEVLTIASMLEREAKIPEERAMIAQVIYNRLDADMPLQIDSSALYPLTNGLYDVEEVTYEDLSYESEYNTYLHDGLPVGPICNPGIACITAVLYPVENTYYYYHVIDEKTGAHHFSETYEEHLATMEEDGVKPGPGEKFSEDEHNDSDDESYDDW